MSYSTLYRLYRTTVTEQGEYRNGWLSAPVLWDHLAETYLGTTMTWGNEEANKGLWALGSDPRVPKCMRAAHLMTFDNACIAKDRLVEAAELCRETGRLLTRENHWGRIGDDLDVIAKAKDHRLIGAVLNCTSVNEVWRYRKHPSKEAWDVMKSLDAVG